MSKERYYKILIGDVDIKSIVYLKSRRTIEMVATTTTATLEDATREEAENVLAAELYLRASQRDHNSEK